MIKVAMIAAVLLACVVAVFLLRRAGQASADPSEFPMIYNVPNFMNGLPSKVLHPIAPPFVSSASGIPAKYLSRERRHAHPDGHRARRCPRRR